MKDGLFQILFVCTGNICRSPMAEGLLRARMSARAAEFATVKSAGVSAPTGLLASPHSITVCADNGIDISPHRSRAISPLMIRKTDLILTMEEHHREAILDMVPEARDKTFLLTNYAGDTDLLNAGIPDPIGYEIGMYREVFELLDRQICRALPRIETSIAEAGKSV